MTQPAFIIPERLPGATDKYSQRDEDEFRRRLELLLRRVNEASNIANDRLPKRRLTRHNITIPSGFDAVSVDLLFRDVTGNLQEFAGQWLLQARCDTEDAWFRVYGSAADRTADLALRPNWNSVDVAVETPMIMDALFGNGEDDIKLINGDVDGIPAFNRDDPAVLKLYARLDLPVGTSVGSPTYHEVFGPATVTEALSVSSPFTYNGSGSPSRYYRQAPFGAVWSPVSSTVNVARWSGGTVDHSGDLIHRILVSVAPNDAATWGVWACFYVDDDASASVFNNLNLHIGVDRGGAFAPRAHIQWIDGSGVVTTLGASAPFSAPAHSSFWIIAKVRTVGADKIASVSTAPYEDPSDITLRLDDIVVPAGVQIAGHDRAGFLMTRAQDNSVPGAYTGLWVAEVEFGAVALDPIVVPVDLGWTPYEQAGGDLTTPLAP